VIRTLQEYLTIHAGNTGMDGGGIALYGGSQIILEKSTSQLAIYTM
jgi:hypothetical protein